MLKHLAIIPQIALYRKTACSCIGTLLVESDRLCSKQSSDLEGQLKAVHQLLLLLDDLQVV